MDACKTDLVCLSPSNVVFQSTAAHMIEKKLVERGSFWGGLKSELPIALVIPTYETGFSETQGSGLGKKENEESQNNIGEGAISSAKEEEKVKEDKKGEKEIDSEKERIREQIQSPHRLRAIPLSYIPYPNPSSWCGDHQSTILRKPYIYSDALHYAFDNSPSSNIEDVEISFTAEVYSYTLLYSTLLYSPLLYSTLLYSTLLYSTLLYSTQLYSTLLSSTLLHSTPLYSTLLYSTLLYSTPLYYTLLYSVLFYSTLLYSTPIH